MKTMTIANQNTVAAKAVKEEKIMNTRFVITVIVGSICNMKQVNQFKKYLATIKKSNVDILVAGNPIRVQKLGRVINESKAPVRMIGCGVKNNNIFAYTHQDEHPCVWAIDHADAVIAIGEGSVVTKAIDYAFKTSRSCYIYGKEFKDSICRGHYDKEIIMRADIVTLNESKADPIAVAKAELDAAKKAYEAAQAKYDKLVAESKPAVKEEVVGRGAELFVDAELSADMGTVTQNAQQYKSIAQEVEEELAAPVDTTGDIINFRGKNYEVMVDDFEPLDTEDVEKAIKNGDLRPIGKSHNDMAKMVNAIADAKPAADFTFEGKGYNVVVKEAFDIELFNSCDAETQKTVVEESMAAGHIVAA